MALKSYKELLKKQMNEDDYKNYTDFKELIGKGFTDKDLELVYKLHAKYLEHTFNIPCGCGGAKKIDTINKWISDLNTIYDNGMAT
tara:strand:- start:206 stop:463 length:258 start_codon:yes stop_codon:yes gene_type:complete